MRQGASRQRSRLSALRQRKGAGGYASYSPPIALHRSRIPPISTILDSCPPTPLHLCTCSIRHLPGTRTHHPVHIYSRCPYTHLRPPASRRNTSAPRKRTGNAAAPQCSVAMQMQMHRTAPHPTRRASQSTRNRGIAHVQRPAFPPAVIEGWAHDGGGGRGRWRRFCVLLGLVVWAWRVRAHFP